MESWVFLLVGGLGAVGAAMSLGTLVAWIRFERTGEVPGQGTGDDDTDDEGAAVDPGPAVRRRLLLRVVLGAVVAAACVMVLADLDEPTI